jgi:hypothetical protein
VRPDLIRGPRVAVFPVSTGNFISEGPCMSPFWPLIPEIFPVRTEIGNRHCVSSFHEVNHKPIYNKAIELIR